MPTGNTLTSSSRFGLPYIARSLSINTAQWIDLSYLKYVYDEYRTNPVLNSVIRIKGREYRNKRYIVKNRSTGEIEPITTRRTIPYKLYRLLGERPNPLQEFPEFIEQKKIQKELFGNTMLYANAGLEINVNNVFALWNVWPQYMKVQLSGKYFDALSVGDIIKGWKFEYSQNFKKDFKAEEILHQNSPNEDPGNDLILGSPTAWSYVVPLSNIKGAYESRNVIIRNRGMDLVFTSDVGDASGKVMMQDTEKKVFQEEMKDYGLLEGQKQFFASSLPLKVTVVNRDVAKLGLFEEVATDGMIICNGWGVPDELLRLWLKGTTYENMRESVRRLYQGTLIPESEEEDKGLNAFLKTEETDWIIGGSFAHVEALQRSRKEEADANKSISEYMFRLFKIGGVTLNRWLKEVNLPSIGPDGDKFIWQMEPEKVSLILSDGKQQEPKEEDDTKGSEAEEEEKEKRIVRRVLELMQ